MRRHLGSAHGIPEDHGKVLRSDERHEHGRTLRMAREELTKWANNSSDLLLGLTGTW